MALKFRYDISFLRALSVLAVVFYHFDFSFFKGGFVGVDIFFVISGYLMTKIILSGFDKDNFNVLDFYKKRVVRIFPALLTMILIFGVVVYALIPTQFILYLNSAFSSSLFFSNIYYYLNNGYFDQSSHSNFLLHTWSLSVEWQFYMILPLLLLIFKKTYRNSRTKFNFIFIAIVALSFISMLLHNVYSNTFSFFIFYTRAWEMMLGGLSFLYEKELQKISQKIKPLIIGICFLIICYFIIKTEDTNWPSVITLIPVFCTALIIGINHEFEIYKNRIIKYIGDISYSLYLYHWPIFVISFFFGLERLRYSIIFIILSVILSVLSYHFVEKRDYSKKVKQVLLRSAILFGICFFLSKTDANLYLKNAGTFANITANYKNSNTAKKQYNLESRHFNGTRNFADFDKTFLNVPDNHKKNIVLLGDSHAGMFAQTLNNITKENNYNLIQITADGTYPMKDSEGILKGSIDYFNYIFKNYIPANYKKIDLVVITSNYAAYPKEKLDQKIKFSQYYFSKYKIPVLFIGQTKVYPIDFPTYYYSKKKYAVNYPNEESLFDNTVKINNYLNENLGSRYINLLDLNVKQLSPKNYPYLYDKNHLTYYGTEQYREVIQNAILNTMKKNINLKNTTND